MSTQGVNRASDNARTVADGANSLLRALRNGTDPQAAMDRLELRAARCLDQADNFFDAPADSDQEGRLAEAISLLGIGTTLLQADATVDRGGSANDLAGSIASLEGTADAIDLLQAESSRIQRFDGGTGTDGSLRDVALRALDQMAGSACDVVMLVLDKVAGPLIKKVPEGVTDIGKEFASDAPRRLARWALRSVRRGIDLLLRLIDLRTIHRQREIVDSLIDRLQGDSDPGVVVGWVIGADSARMAILAGRPSSSDQDPRAAELHTLADRFARHCRLLRRAGVLIAAAAALLAPWDFASSAWLAPSGMLVVLLATVLLGRAHTGGSENLLGVRGVKIVMQVD